MQVKRIANKITKSYLMDPYAMMMHYKRAFKLLKVMKDNSAKVLILGNKNQFGISWKGRFAGVEFDTGVVDEKLISTAPKHYEMILCLDPVLYCRSLRKINLPVMMCATLREITEHPEILDVTDYLLPSPTRRHDAALRAMVGLDILGEAPQQSDAAPSDTASAASMSTMSTARLIEQGEAPQRADAAPSEAPPSSSTSTSAGQPTEQGEAPQRADAAPSEAPPSRSTSTSAGQPTEQGPSRHEPREKPPEE